jgi:dihydrofolate reductase
MTKPRISIIVAHSQNMAIGKANTLLWHLSDDLKRFKKLTTGHPIIMGRKTYESIGRPLPERTNIIITRDKHSKISGCLVTHSIEEAIEKAKGLDQEEIFIIGGGEIYKQALPLAHKLYLTLVESDKEGDIFFPNWHNDFKKETFREERFDEKTGLTYTWIDLER